jgi:hypothetical protein
VVKGLAVLSLLLCGCHLDVDYTGTAYLCSAAADCPGGMRCVAEVCRPEGSPGGPDAAPGSGDVDADDSDGAPVPDATAADAAGPPNLVSDPGFEASEDGWIGYLATTSLTSTDPHSGAHALRICKDATGHRSFFSVYRDLVVDDAAQVPQGAHYRAEAWIRPSASPSDVAPSFVAPSLRERGGSQPFVNHYGPDLVPVTSTWTLVTVDAIISDADRTGLSLILETGSEADGTCFHVDDVEVVRVP